MLKKVLNRLDPTWQAEVDPSRMLWVGVDISSRQHEACVGTSDRVLRRRLTIANTRDGLAQLEAAISKEGRTIRAQAVIVGMEPSGVYWKPLAAQLRQRGYAVVLVHTKAVRHNRQTMRDGSKTDSKDAFAIWDLLRQGKFFLPLERDAEHEAAYRLMQHYAASRRRSAQIRNQLRAVLALAFPELNERFRHLDGKTALAFLAKNPTPASIRRPGRQRFLTRWRGPHGRWGHKFFEELYELAKHSIGLEEPTGSFEAEIQTLVAEFRRALEDQEHWFQQALARLEHRPEYPLLLSIKGIGPKIAVGLLASLGNVRHFECGKQWVRLAGLDVQLFESGDSVHRTPRISRQGKSLLRTWLYHAAVILVRFDGPFRELYERRKASSPGKGAKSRALMAVADKLVRVIFAMLRDGRVYDPHHDQKIKEVYSRLRMAA